MSLPLCPSLVLDCGWLGSWFCVPECYHDPHCCLNVHLIYYPFHAFRICHFSFSFRYILIVLLWSAFICLISRLLLLTPYYVIGICSNEDAGSYITLLTALIQVSFWINILWANFTTYEHDLYTWLACLWAWLTLLIMHDHVGVIYWWGNTNPIWTLSLQGFSLRYLVQAGHWWSWTFTSLYHLPHA